MNRLIYIALFVLMVVGALLLSGCASTQTAPVQVTAVPIAAQCPAPDVPAKPQIPLAGISDKSSDEEVIEAYAQSLNTCMARVDSLQKLLNGYRHGH